MSAKRSLSAVLNKLCSVEYLTEKKPLQFCLAKNGLNLKKNIVNSMIMGRSDLLTVSNEKDAMKQLKKGFCAITQDREHQDPIFKQTKRSESVKIVRKPKNLLHSWEIIKDVKNEFFAFEEYFRRRRIFWKNLMFDHDNLVTKELDESKAAITAKLDFNTEDKNSGDTDKTIELESLEMLPENFGHNDWKIFHSILDPNAGTMTVLMDASLRYRQFCQTSRLSLPMKIAPIPLGLLIEEPFDGKNETIEILHDLANYVEYLITHENIEILKGFDYQTYDDLGVPYVIVIDESSLDQGVIKIRDRETTWYEQIHLAHIAQRMVKAFQDRDIPDAYNLTIKKYYPD